MTTALCYHPAFLKHNTGWKHPEQRQRLVAIIDRLKASGLLDRLLRIEPASAPLSALAAIHDPAYIEEFKVCCAREKVFEVTADTVACRDTFEAALLAAGAVLSAIDAVMDGRAANAFCAVRPPGHHAERGHAMGFCFFNNVAIGARYLQQRHRIERVAIIDWDVHHGNGTQNAFYDDPSVFYVSLHQFPHYPGSGGAGEKGAGAGMGFTLNLPMAAGSTGTDYRQAFDRQIAPAMARFKPEFILISAGFDAHRDDPLASLLLTEDDYAALTRSVLDMAKAQGHHRVVSVLEGGYRLEALAASVEGHVRELMS
jgi:acetoin utilization deacetylase AcuC-like enzyme